MGEMFFRNLGTPVSVKIGSYPKDRPEECPYCHKSLYKHDDDLFLAGPGHDHLWHIRFCAGCGWWDVIYGNDGYAHDSAWDSHYTANLHQADPQVLDQLNTVSMVNELALHYEKIYKLSPRDVEKVIHSIYKNYFDCDVQLTLSTRDGGKDIIGFDSEKGSFIVEVKRYHQQNKVGVSLIRQLLGVMCIDHVSRGVFVTTGTFTHDARQIAQMINNDNTQWNIELKDMNDLKSWLKLSYEKYFDLTVLDQALKNISDGNVTFPRKLYNPTTCEYIQFN